MKINLIIKKPNLWLATMMILLIAATLYSQSGSGVKYFTRNASASFFSEAPLEKIEASTNSASSVIDMATGNVEVAVLIKSFNFKKALMQEHFNENYLESNKFPKAVFKGTMPEFKTINLTTDGKYTTLLKGAITIHGVTKPLETKVLIRSEGGKIFAETEFELIVADFNISIPSVVRDNVAKMVMVKLKAEFTELKKT